MYQNHQRAKISAMHKLGVNTNH
uniref:Uncharacterized protein n=1 Tax=Cupriavidus taiwanensis TaxID=164546 RepID=A0A375HFZ7_9BURK|nr:protein of unknown function [Cupriavidus taiwanensis]